MTAVTLDLDKVRCLLVSLNLEFCSVGYESWLMVPKSSSELEIIIKHVQPVKMYWPDSPLEKDEEIEARKWTKRFVIIHAMGGNDFFLMLKFL